MRFSLLTPSAAVAGRTYPYRWKAMVPDWPTVIRTRRLPDGCYEISTNASAPAVIPRGLYFFRTAYQCVNRH